MADQGYCKLRAKCRLKISASTARLRLKLAADWQGFDFRRNRFRFSDKCSIACGSGHNTT